MKRSSWVVPGVAAIAAASVAIAASEAPITESCNTTYGDPRIFIDGHPDLTARIVAAANDSNGDPELRRRLWQPVAGEYREYRIGDTTVSTAVISFVQAQDTREVAASIQADPLFDVSSVRVATFSCYAVMPPAIPVTVTEYYNEVTGHYFMSSSPGENDIIDAGGAGEGWRRTGESFTAVKVAPGGCNGDDPVFRFYGPGPNSHFFTVDAKECGFQRKNGTGWVYEGIAFSARLPVNGACEAAYQTPVYRLYNNRWMYNDSNHRFVTSRDLYASMQAQGWTGEGIAMCVRAR
jgi:hypothetical protein